MGGGFGQGSKIQVPEELVFGLNRHQFGFFLLSE